MAGLPWVRVDASLIEHPKLHHLAHIVESYPEALTAVVQLWCYAARIAPSGLIRGAGAARAIEFGVGWKGEAGKLLRAFVESGWLDEVENGYAVRHWKEYQGAHFEKAALDRVRSRDRMRRLRERYRGVTRNNRGNSNGNENSNVTEQQPTTFPPPAERSAPRSKPVKSADPRHAPLVAALVAEFKAARGESYGFSPRDAKATAELLRMAGDGGPDEVLRRWRAALVNPDRYRRVDAIFELPTRWNAQVGDVPAVKQMAMTPAPHSAFAGGGYVDTRK